MTSADAKTIEYVRGLNPEQKGIALRELLGEVIAQNGDAEPIPLTFEDGATLGTLVPHRPIPKRIEELNLQISEEDRRHINRIAEIGGGIEPTALMEQLNFDVDLPVASR